LAILFCFSLLFSGCTTPMEKYLLNSQYHQATQYYEKNLSPEKSDLADLYYYCLSLYEIKNYEKFNHCHDTLFRRAQGVSTISRTSRDATLAEIHAFKARNMIDFGTDIAEIQKEVDYSLALLQKAPENFHNGFKMAEIRVYETAGILAAIKGDAATALDYINKIKRVTSMAEFQLRPMKNAASAGIYFILKDYAQAKKVIEEYSGDAFWAFTQALEVMMVFPLLVHYADVGTDTSLDAWTEHGRVLSEFMLAKIFFETGNYPEARKGYEKLLGQKMSAHYERLRWSTMADLASIYRKEGRRQESIQHWEQAVNLIENQRKSIFAEGSKIGFVGDKQSVYHDLIQALFEDKQYEKAFEYVERAKSRALVDLLAAKKDFASKGGNEQEIRKLIAANDAQDARIALQLEAGDAAKTRSIQIRTKEELKNKAPELSSLLTVTYEPTAALLKQIAASEALIEYYYRDKNMYAFILADNRLQAIQLDSAGLAEDVQNLRKLIDHPGSTQFLQAAEKLYQRLFQPLERALNKQKLIIVPHGVLHYLPLNALYDCRGYLIDRYSIRMMPSASAMKYLGGKKTAGHDGILIFGNPDLGNPRFDLEYAQKEALELARIRPQSKAFVRKEATEEALRRYAQDYRYLHFATHGQFDPQSPLQSALLLAPDLKFNGLLSVDKIYSLKLDAELVTLSACETGLSKIANGDDLVGLTRGFLYAGSNSIVASLWKVDDQATAELITGFYLELPHGDKVEALRKAQLATKKKYPHPYYWASFQLTGSAQ